MTFEEAREVVRKRLAENDMGEYAPVTLLDKLTDDIAITLWLETTYRRSGE